MAHGETKEQALKGIEIAKELWIETAKEDGEERYDAIGNFYKKFSFHKILFDV